MSFILIKLSKGGDLKIIPRKKKEKTGDKIYFIEESSDRKFKAEVVGEGDETELKKKLKETQEEKETNISRHKEHRCLFCLQNFSQINMHYRRRHKKEERIIKIMNMKDPKEKQLAWAKLRNAGDKLFNKTIFNGEAGELISMRRLKVPTRKRKYIYCENCSGRILSKSLRRHKTVCSRRAEDEEEEEKEATDDFYNDVIKGMRGEIPDFILKHREIYLFGKNLWEERGYGLINVVREKLRDLIDLIEDLRKPNDSIKIEDFFSVGYVDAILELIKKKADFRKAEKNIEIKFPSKMLRYIRVTNDFAQFLKINSIKERRREQAEEREGFLTVFDAETSKKLKKFIKLLAVRTE